jgi:hypothetical protein
LLPYGLKNMNRCRRTSKGAVMVCAMAAPYSQVPQLRCWLGHRPVEPAQIFPKDTLRPQANYIKLAGFVSASEDYVQPIASHAAMSGDLSKSNLLFAPETAALAMAAGARRP